MATIKGEKCFTSFLVERFCPQVCRFFNTINFDVLNVHVQNSGDVNMIKKKQKIIDNNDAFTLPADDFLLIHLDNVTIMQLVA